MLRFPLALIIALVLGTAAQAADIRTAVVAGGCFWCVESDFDAVPGVTGTVSGYAGGTTVNPTYKKVTRGGTGHYEVVEITYDAEELSYEQLIHLFLRSVDPTDPGGQFCDRGDSYRTAIFVGSDAERAVAEAAVDEAEAALGQPIVTEILPDAKFYPAEGYHQDFYQKNPLRYTAYRRGCRRDERVKALWGDQAIKGHS